MRTQAESLYSLLLGLGMRIATQDRSNHAVIVVFIVVVVVLVIVVELTQTPEDDL